MNKVESELGQMKCQFADQAYEYELKLAKLNKYIDKLKGKLTKMGFKFRSKKRKIKMKVKLILNIYFIIQ